MSFKVKAIYEYASGHEDDLAFPVGQIITVTDEDDADWYGGEYLDDAGVKHEGIFPRNFVERYEPTAPPRPTRTRTKKEADAGDGHDASAVASSSFPKQVFTEAQPVSEDESELMPSYPPTNTASASPPAPAAFSEPPTPKPAQPVRVETASVPPAPKPAEPATATSLVPKAMPTQPKSSPHPLVAEKPQASSFKDRIAAFNKPAAPPVAPLKPSSLGSGNTGFIKKPFVAPPPSRHAYIPPSRDVPVAKVHRREEDAEIREQEMETMEKVEKASLAAKFSTTGAEEDEEQAKPLSLKERMALLQKQQMEAAARHADVVAKKEKPKRPPKKRAEQQDTLAEGAPLASPTSIEAGGSDENNKRCLDEVHPPRLPHAHRRRSSRGPEPRDGNEADMSGAGEASTEGQDDDLTEKEQGDERGKHLAIVVKQEDDRIDEEEDDQDEDDEVDAEVKRKQELRARMAKMSGGMGMASMFGMPMAGVLAPPKKNKSAEKKVLEAEDVGPSSARVPPVPVMVLPGMSRVRSPERQTTGTEQVMSDDDRPADELQTGQQEGRAREATSVHSIAGGRPAPPPLPAESRSTRLPIATTTVLSQSEGSESDDELSERATPKSDLSPSMRAPPPPPLVVLPAAGLTSPRADRGQFFSEESLPASPSGAAPQASNKGNSRHPPPVPGCAPPVPSAQTRPPPPPPPVAAAKAEREEEVTEYEGDYDTDIASLVPHKDALKAHQRGSSLDEARSPLAEARPIPASAPPTAGPPPVPGQPPPVRKSVDMPRVAPPPPPMREIPRYDDDDKDDYDPFRHKAASPVKTNMASYTQSPPPPLPSARSPEPPGISPRLPQVHDVPPFSPPISSTSLPAHPSGRVSRPSIDVTRSIPGRRSVDVVRPSMESSFVANDVDLASQAGWWLQPDGLPAQLQGRRDIFSESEEGREAEAEKVMVTREIYILFQDYSQTVLSVRFDPQDASDVYLEQRHEPPPRAPRQDQLEQSYERFGRAIGEAAAGKKDTIVGDGTSQGLVSELLRPLQDALFPVSTRAYGALVYSNLANASTTQNDEIRPGDIMSIRNAKFQGKHGPMHAKYSNEVGKPDHVAVVAEWDGTKKKVRAWEQGRENRKVKMESYKLDDLRSGEVKIWRVMPRSWIGWESPAATGKH